MKAAPVEVIYMSMLSVGAVILTHVTSWVFPCRPLRAGAFEFFNFFFKFSLVFIFLLTPDADIMLQTHTGDVLIGCDNSEGSSFNIDDIPSIQVPQPVFFCSIEPPTLSAQKVLDDALQCLSREDPSLKVTFDESTGQTILGGMGELHMEIVKDRILKVRNCQWNGKCIHWILLV